MVDFADAHPVESYRSLLVDPAWRRWTLVSAFSRLPLAIAPLALVLVGRYATGSFADGALLAGAYAFAESLPAPWLGRLLDRRERRGGLALHLGSTVAALAGVLICVLTHASFPVLLLATIAAAALPAAVQSGLRAFLVELVGRRAPLAFALDAALIEVEWMSGSALVAALALVDMSYLTVAAMLAATTAALLGTRLLPVSEPALDLAGNGHSPWRHPPAVRLYLTSAVQGYTEGTVVVALAPLLVALHARAGLAGFLLVSLSLASAAGGLLFGALQARVPGTGSQQAAAVSLALALLAIPIATATSVAMVTVAVAAFGVVIAPLNALRTQLLSEAVAASQRGEAFAILWGAMGLGWGVAGVVVGGLLGLLGPGGAIIAGAAIAIAGSLASQFAGRTRFE